MKKKIIASKENKHFEIDCFDFVYSLLRVREKNIDNSSFKGGYKSTFVPLEGDKTQHFIKHLFDPILQREQSGAVEACWAHNPEVRGSKPRSAKYFF